MGTNVLSAVVLVGSLLGVLLVLGTIYIWLANKGILFPDFALPMLLLAGVVLFLGAIAVLVNVYRSIGLQDQQHALGLPEGSVRAIIALILVFLFFVAVTFIYSSALRGGGVTSLQGLTPTQFAQIPVADLVSSTPHPLSNPTSYDVMVRTNVPRAAEDIGKNLVVLLGTLVTAVAAFYFGTNSATSAAAAARQDRQTGGGAAPPSPPVVGRITPDKGPVAGGEEVTITGSGFTVDSAVTFGTAAATSVTVDSDSQIRAVSPPGSAGAADVTVTTAAGTSRATYTYV